MKITSIATTFLLTVSLLFTASVRAADNPALMEPVKSVLDHYLAIQSELAKDSVKGLDEHANAIAKAVKGDGMKMLSPDVAKQAETLAKKLDDIADAMDLFKPRKKNGFGVGKTPGAINPDGIEQISFRGTQVSAPRGKCGRSVTGGAVLPVARRARTVVEFGPR